MEVWVVDYQKAKKLKGILSDFVILLDEYISFKDEAESYRKKNGYYKIKRDDWEAKIEWERNHQWDSYHDDPGPVLRGSLRRRSMDLTRALADFRRP